VNWMLMLATIGLVFGFGSSSAMASAYGVAVTLTMLITTILAYKLARRSWGWGRWRAAALSALFLLPESIFVWANLSKLQEGGWVALLVAAMLFVLMTTWQRGRGILARRFREQHVPLTNFFERIKQDNPGRVPGTVVFMTSSLDGTPPALLRNYQHNHVVHERVILLSVVTGEVANVTEAERGTVEQLEHGFSRVIARYGFMERPDIPALLLRTGVIESLQQTSFFLGRETMIVSDRSGMSKWRVVLFTFLSSNAQSATKFFNIPPDRVMEIGAQVVL
jgi:KUP system potassium uptake protein